MYLRASQDRSGRSISVGTQYDEGSEYFEDNDIRLHQVYSDNNLSASLHATHDGRDDYERALDDLRSGRANLLWTFDHSRAQRDLEVYVRLRKICIETGALWAYGGRIYDMSDPKDRKDTARDAVDSEGAADNISIHTTRGIRGRAKRGEHAGKPAYGYRPLYSQETGESLGWVIVEDEARVLRRIVRWCLARKKLSWIARQLNAEGVPTPQDRKWNKTLVITLEREQRHAEEWQKFLASLSPEDRQWADTVVRRVRKGENPTEIGRELNRNGVLYFVPGQWNASKVRNLALSLPAAGLRRYHGEVVMRRVPDPDNPGSYRMEPVPVQWKGIVSPQEHAKLKALFSDPNRVTRRDGTRVRHQWSGIAKCGVCGSHTTRAKNRQDTPVLRCFAKGCVTRIQELVEAYLTEVALRLLEREDAARIFRLHEVASESGEALREAEELRAQLDGFRAQALRKEISAESFAIFEADLLPRITRADAKAQRATLPKAVADLVGSGVDVRTTVLSLDVAQQREIFAAIMRPRILPTRRKVRGVLDTSAIDPGFLYPIPEGDPVPLDAPENATAQAA